MSTAIGRLAEDAAATFLRGKGFDILAQNWRTRWCEIDVVANKNSRVYFVEVKYRGNSQWGSGLEYITPRKLMQMHFAAEFWIASHGQRGARAYALSAIELTDNPPQVTQWLEDVGE
ncbi:MAG TPA: YraN family protein [Candidatus Saccharimonas sp.]|nr:YraN family protein [Candidatus Saccharimonas sp.]